MQQTKLMPRTKSPKTKTKPTASLSLEATTRRLAVMNLALRSIGADFGTEHADTYVVRERQAA